MCTALKLLDCQRGLVPFIQNHENFRTVYSYTPFSNMKFSRVFALVVDYSMITTDLLKTN